MRSIHALKVTAIRNEDRTSDGSAVGTLGDTEKRETVAAGVTVVSETLPHMVKLTVCNDSILLYSLSFNFSESVNTRVVPLSPDVTCDTKLSASIVLPPKKSRLFVSLQRIISGRPFAVKYSVQFSTENVKTDNERLREETQRVIQLAANVDDPEEIAAICLNAGIVFLDISFPPDDNSLPPEHNTAVWKRPTDFSKSPLPVILFDAQVAPKHVVQGCLHNRSFLAAISAMVEFPHMLHRVLPLDCTDLCGGIVRARVCVNGWWEKLVLDTLLPCDATTVTPLYSTCNDLRYQWVSALEKVYAKAYGSYNSLQTATVGAVLMDLTGSTFEFTAIDSDFLQRSELCTVLWNNLTLWDAENYAVVASTAPEDRSSYTTEAGSAAPREVGDDNSNDFYTVLCARENKGIRVVKLRKLLNTDDSEQSIPASEVLHSESQIWSPRTKRDLGFTTAKDGTMWMTFDSFVKSFRSITTCYYSPHWSEARLKGYFSKGGLSDICVELWVHAATSVTVTGRSGGALPVFVNLSQIDIRTPGNTQGGYHPATIFVLQPAESGGYRCTSFSEYLTQRDVSMHLYLEPCDRPYLIVPATGVVGVTFNYVLSVRTPLLEPTRLSIRSCTKELLERVEFLACMNRGREVSIAKFGCLKILQDQYCAYVCAVNRSALMWEVTVDFTRSVGYRSRSDQLVYTVLVPGQSHKFVAPLFRQRGRTADCRLEYAISDRSLRAGGITGDADRWLEFSLDPALLPYLQREIQWNAGDSLVLKPQPKEVRKTDTATEKESATERPKGGKPPTHRLTRPMTAPPMGRASRLDVSDSDASTSGASPFPSVVRGSGTIIPKTRSRFRMDHSGVAFTDQQIAELWTMFDTDGKGWIDRKDFVDHYAGWEAFGLDEAAVFSHRTSQSILYSKTDNKLSFNEFAILMLQRAKW